ncbi:zinc finger protein ZAT11-like [Eucalyptus grandis]|uniref:zinc finger protein ZAT11-like n=1 Tax=Eucalyptus grandis TaxID=71139 RepID=UPI00192EC767|nr:zinc finger protein ZAT11-like [Eucalyptus grandis]
MTFSCAPTLKRTRDDCEGMSLDMAKCLMLLSHGVNTNPRKAAVHHDEDNFECKTCNRRFSSFQALGGHRASHKKPRLLETMKLEDCTKLALGSMAKPKMHECSMCGLKFASGQALGGHMRRHRAELMSGDMMKMDEILAVGSMIPLLKRSNSSKRVMGLDLNLSPLENDLKFLFGKMAPKIDPVFL